MTQIRLSAARLLASAVSIALLALAPAVHADALQDISKQILLKADTAIEVPLFRTKLSAEEMKEVLDKARVNVIAGTGGVEPAWIINTVDSGK